MNRKIELFMSIALLGSAILLAKEGAVFVQSNYITSNYTTEQISDTTQTESNSICIVIDAGHGGDSYRPKIKLAFFQYQYIFG